MDPKTGESILQVALDVLNLKRVTTTFSSVGGLLKFEFWLVESAQRRLLFKSLTGRLLERKKANFVLNNAYRIF